MCTGGLLNWLFWVWIYESGCGFQEPGAVKTQIPIPGSIVDVVSVPAAMRIQCSDATYQLLSNIGTFNLECRGNIEIKVMNVLPMPLGVYLEVEDFQQPVHTVFAGSDAAGYFTNSFTPLPEVTNWVIEDRCQFLLANCICVQLDCFLLLVSQGL